MVREKRDIREGMDKKDKKNRRDRVREKEKQRVFKTSVALQSLAKECMRKQ